MILAWSVEMLLESPELLGREEQDWSSGDSSELV
jgi:hypothetical protein